jgi:hypothetical protein
MMESVSPKLDDPGDSSARRSLILAFAGSSASWMTLVIPQ